jgi:hypothetical protein
MTDPINLNRFRKEKMRQEARQQADRNAATFGMTKAERQRARAEAERVARQQDGGRIDHPTDET